MKTLEVLEEVVAGKRMSENYEVIFREVFGSLGKLYEEFPERSVEVNKWLASLDGFADTSVRLWFTVLRIACRYMAENYDLPNPCKGLVAPKVQKHKRRYFRPEELGMIIRSCRDEYEMALVTTLVDSACRVGELASLRAEDIGDSWIDVKGKTGDKRYRLDSRICEVLKRLDGGEGQVFGSDGQALSMRVRRICKRAGLTGRKLGAHTLRHSSASLVASETKNVLAVKAILQHDKVDTSMLYIHDVEEELQKGISPLQLVADRLKDTVYSQKLLTVSGVPASEEVEVVEGDGVDELVSALYPEIGVSVAVRPLLKADDLRVIRQIMIGYARYDGNDAVNERGRDLLKRILRRVR